MAFGQHQEYIITLQEEVFLVSHKDEVVPVVQKTGGISSYFQPLLIIYDFISLKYFLICNSLLI